MLSHNHFRKQLSSKSENVHPPRLRNFTTGDAHSHRNVNEYRNILCYAMLFLRVNICKQPQSPTVRDWINNNSSVLKSYLQVWT